MPFDCEAVVSTLHEAVASLAPSAGVRYETGGRRVAAGAIVKRTHKLVREGDASTAFVG